MRPALAAVALGPQSSPNDAEALAGAANAYARLLEYDKAAALLERQTKR
jgi:hypothetical protein